jgi:AcrR family transcriptional regulator
MGRKQVFSRSELLDQAKRVLLDHGYDGFQLKLLSQSLAGARSTIYQYFANKEEIVAACMRRVMEDILQQASAIDETDCMDALQQLLTVYLSEAGLHQLLGYAHKVNKANSAAAATDLDFVEEAHQTLRQQLERLFGRAQAEGYLNPDIPLPAMIGVYFNLINTPNMMNLPISQWSKILYRLWLEGAGKH